MQATASSRSSLSLSGRWAGSLPSPGEKYHEYLDAEAAMRAHLDLENPSEVQRAHELLPHVIALQREAREEAVTGYNQVLNEIMQNQVMVMFFAPAKGLLALCALWGGGMRATGISMGTAAVLVAVPVGLEVLLIMTGLVAHNHPGICGGGGGCGGREEEPHHPRTWQKMTPGPRIVRTWA